MLPSPGVRQALGAEADPATGGRRFVILQEERRGERQGAQGRVEWIALVEEIGACRDEKKGKVK